MKVSHSCVYTDKLKVTAFKFIKSVFICRLSFVGIQRDVKLLSFIIISNSSGRSGLSDRYIALLKVKK